MFPSYVVWGASILLPTFIIIRGYRERMLEEYRVVYFYIALLLAVDSIRALVAIMFGRASGAYYYVYYVPTLVMPAIQLLVIWDVYIRLVEMEYRRKELVRWSLLMTLLAVPVLLAALALEGDDFFFRFHTVTLFAQTVSCGIVCHKAASSRSSITLGRNLLAILTGISLMVGGQMGNFAFFVFGDTAEGVFWFLVPYIHFLSLSVLTFGLWSYEPMQLGVLRETERPSRNESGE